MNFLRTAPASISWGLAGTTGQIRKFNTIEVLLFFTAGSPAEAAALPTVIGSVQVEWIDPKQRRFCHATCIRFPFSCLSKQAQTSWGFPLSPKQGVYTVNVFILHKTIARQLGKHWSLAFSFTTCHCRVSQKSLQIIPTDFLWKQNLQRSFSSPQHSRQE